MIQRVLIPLDGSVQAERILSRARAFFVAPGTEFNLLAVVDMEGRIADQTVPITCSGHRAKQYLAAVAKKLADQGVQVATDVRFGPAAEKILEHARDHHVDVIAMSTHGRTGLERVVRGSVAEAVLRGANVPVFLARTGEGTRPADRTGEGRRILVPLDGSAGSEAILPYVRTLARTLDAVVEVLRVAEWIPPASLAPHGNVQANAWTLRAENYVRQVCEQLRAEGITAEPVVEHGAPAERILGHAGTPGIGLVAMSTHGYSGVRRLVFGSVAEEVLRQLTVPLFAVRESVPAPLAPAAPANEAPQE